MKAECKVEEAIQRSIASAWQVVIRCSEMEANAMHSVLKARGAEWADTRMGAIYRGRSPDWAIEIEIDYDLEPPVRAVALTPEAWRVVLDALEIISPDDDEHAQIAIDTMAEIRRVL